MRTRQHLGQVIVVLSIAAFAAPAAMAGSSAASVSDARSPDTVDAGLAAHTAGTVFDRRSPDTIDAAVAAAAVSRDGFKPIAWRATALPDGRSPDTLDAAIQAHSPVVTNLKSPVVTNVKSPGFDWTDFAIGVAAALGAILVFRFSMTAFGIRKSSAGRLSDHRGDARPQFLR